ncbi:MAG: lipocalin family protein [Pseudoxanthomonas sp.]|nr:lipocalin family protein [Pseudoxanthomonas sp.]
MRALPTLLLICLAFWSPARAAVPVSSVPDLELTRYAGHWYEIAHLPVSFQRQCVGDITASYALRADGTISVHNTCRTRFGTQAETDGVARTVKGHPGRLQVRFAPGWLSWLPMVWADYWVVALDPGYQWAVVGDPERKYLWILSREPTMDAMLFAGLKAKAEAMGYDLAPLVVAAPLR